MSVDNNFTKKKVNIHKFITTIYNPNLNEFMISISDSGLGPSISEGRIIYGKNKLHLSSDGFSLFQIRNDLFHLGATQSPDFNVDYDSFLLSLEPLYKFYLKKMGTYLATKIEVVFRSTDLMLGTNYYSTKLSKSNADSTENPLDLVVKNELKILKVKQSKYKQTNLPKTDDELNSISNINRENENLLIENTNYNNYDIETGNLSARDPQKSWAGMPRLSLLRINLSIIRKPIIWYLIYWAFIGYILFTPLSSHGWLTTWVQNFLFAVSVILGLYPAYWLMKRVDRMSLDSDLKIWGLRLASLGVIVGSFFFMMMGFSFAWTSATLRGSHGEGYILSYFVYAFAFGLLLLSGFMLFRFRRSSGYIVYTR